MEDDEEINAIVSERLDANGHACDPAYSGSEGLALLAINDYDLVICDLMLPGVPGERIVEAARACGTPLIVISARADIADKVSLLELGANDYLTKPFDLEELQARVAVQLRGTACQPMEMNKLQVGAWVIDPEARTLTISGAEVALTRIEYNIAEVLARRPNRVFTRPELFEAAWGEPYRDDANTVNVHVSTLRTKLKPTGTDGYLRTVWGVGFKLVPRGGA
ncbi:MAG: response regulator transcription factor [Coriobacteriia bacterium]|nr:response regulator transcription factor [Coriobacteriia bacterium]